MKDKGERGQAWAGKPSDNAGLTPVKGEGIQKLGRNNSGCSVTLKSLSNPKGSSGAKNACRNPLNVLVPTLCSTFK